MTTTAPSGWGANGWGLGPWGAGLLALSLEQAQPVRENVVRLFFNTAVRFTGILDPNDASNPLRYQITTVLRTRVDGADPRPVRPVKAEVAAAAGALGSQIDVTVDRRFTSFPALYSVCVNQLQSVSGGLLVPTATEAPFDGLLAWRPPSRRDLAVPVRDIANPQTREALFDPLPITDDELALGTIPTDENGDYAFDEGITNFKKRIFRRLTTSKGSFGGLPNYGVGVPGQLKKLGRRSVREDLASEAEAQILEEPESEAVSVRIIPDDVNPGVFRMQIKVKATTLSSDPIQMTVPFAPIGS